jgi:hypothetical protein
MLLAWGVFGHEDLLGDTPSSIGFLVPNQHTAPLGLGAEIGSMAAVKRR